MHDHHAHAPSAAGGSQARLGLALVLAAAYMVAEVLGGLWTGSLALLADAGHMLSDVFALGFSLVALRIAQRPPSPKRTYGYHRTEILAALAHGVLLVCVSIYVFSEAVERIGAPREILGGPMLAVAAGGLVINLIGLAILSRGRRENLNVRGAWLHVLSDALGSVGAMIAGALVWAFGWGWADPAASMLIGVLIIYSSWTLLREALSILMEDAPAHIEVEAVRAVIDDLSGVVAVHDLHVWTISSGLVSLSGHVVAEDGVDHADLLQRICDLLYKRFEIDHATVQIEPPDFRDPGRPVCP